MDIGWLQVNIEKRGQGYAKQLVSFFIQDCLNNGKIPRYSFAMTNESEKVAEACGFTKKTIQKHRVKIEY